MGLAAARKNNKEIEKAHAQSVAAQAEAIGEADKANNENLNEARAQYYRELAAPRYAAQVILDRTAQHVKDRNAARRGTQRVVGGTTASTQAGSQEDANMLGQQTQQAVAQAMDQRTQARANLSQAERQHRAQQATINGDRKNLAAQDAQWKTEHEQQKRQQTMQGIQQMFGGAGNVAAGVAQSAGNKAEIKSSAGGMQAQAQVPAAGSGAIGTTPNYSNMTLHQMENTVAGKSNTSVLQSQGTATTQAQTAPAGGLASKVNVANYGAQKLKELQRT